MVVVITKGKKMCAKCKRYLPISNFFKDNKAKTGLHTYCKSCCKLNAKNYRKKYRESYNLKEKKKKSLKRYGISEQQFLEMLKRQKGRCAICKRLPNGKHKSLHIDHCHKTGKIRGLLCSTCNLALGQLGDSEESILIVLSYLKGQLS